MLLAPAEIEEEDRELAKALLEQKHRGDRRGLVRVHRARMPAAEELADAGAAPRGRPEGPRPGFEDTIWFRMDIGRRHNADPRWILPLLCRRGHITKNEIGAIRIAAGETMFEVPRAVAGKFAAALKRTASGDSDGEGGIRIEAVEGKPRDAARENRRSGPPSATGRSRFGAGEAGPLSAIGGVKGRGGLDHAAAQDDQADPPTFGDFGERVAVHDDQRCLDAGPDRAGAAPHEAVRVTVAGRAPGAASGGPDSGRARRAALRRAVRAVGAGKIGTPARKRAADERAHARIGRCLSARRSGVSSRQLVRRR